MFWTIGLILLALWALGLAAGGTVGAWIHLFLLFAMISFGLAVVQATRRRAG